MGFIQTSGGMAFASVPVLPLPKCIQMCCSGLHIGASLLSCGFIESDTADMLQGMFACVFCGYSSVGLHSGADQRSQKGSMADYCRNLGKTTTRFRGDFQNPGLRRALTPIPEHELMWLRGFFLPEVTSQNLALTIFKQTRGIKTACTVVVMYVSIESCEFNFSNLNFAESSVFCSVSIPWKTFTKALMG